MKSILISLLFIFTLNAQNVWYVDRDSLGATRTRPDLSDGESWATAWRSMGSAYGFPGEDIYGIDWDVIGDGDTIYVSGGTDSTKYMTMTNDGILYIAASGYDDGEGELTPTYKTFSTKVVMCPSWESGHNGDVYITERNTTQSYMVNIIGIRGLKLIGFKFAHQFSTSVATGLTIYGRDNEIDSCHFFGNGTVALGVSIAGRNNTVSYCLLENPYSNDEGELDLASHVTGIGGCTFKNNTIIYRNGNVGTDAHRDFFQASNFGYLEQAPDSVAEVVIANNFFIDTRPEGSSWNGGFYFSGAYTAYNAYVYNNILVSQKTATSMTPIWMGVPGPLDTGQVGYPNEWQENGLCFQSNLWLLNNTIICKGSPNSKLFDAYGYNHIYAHNNLFITDTTFDLLVGINLYDDLVTVDGSWEDTMYFHINNNGYFEKGGISGSFSQGAGFGNFDLEDWLAYEADGMMLDQNSIFGSSDTVEFINKYDSVATGYYTTTGRNLGMDLSSEYPDLLEKFPDIAYDILGNARTTWDMGALEYPTIQHNKWVGLGHSVMRRYNDYSLVFEDSTAPTAVEEIYKQFNSQYEWGADSIAWDWKYFPEAPYGTDWINWLYCFRGEIDDTSDNWLTSIINEYEVIIVKGGIQTCDMTDLYGSSADTSGAGVTKKSVYNYKWIWREMLEYMEAQPDKFFVLMPGSGSGDYKALGSQVGIVAKEFAGWCEDTLQAGLDPIYGAFPENVYVFNQFKYLTDSEGWLKDEYESRTPDPDDHPNATAMTYVVPLFVQEIGDAVLAWEGNQIPETPVDSLPNSFTFTDITGATRSTVYTSNTITLAGFDSAYARAGGAEFSVNGSGYGTAYVKVFPSDQIVVRLTSSANYSTGTSVTLTVGSRSDTYTVTTEAEPVTPPTTGKWAKQNNGRGIFLSDGKAMITK